MGLLGDIYSASDSLKRRLKGLLSDPVGEVSQSLGILADDLKTRGKRNERIIHNPETLTRQDVSEMLASATNFAPIGMTVWHGSPHKFSKFDMSKIGTGEGAQAYGHGLYTGEAKQVGMEYMNKLAGSDKGMSGSIAANALKGRTPEAAIEHLTGQLRGTSDNQKVVQEAIDLIKNGDANTGYLYKVDIPDEAVARFLDWDKPLSQQPDAIRKLLSDASEVRVRPYGPNPYGGPEMAGVEVKLPGNGWADSGSYQLDKANQVVQDKTKLIGEIPFKGKSLYEMFSRSLGGDDAATAFFKQQGIPGIRYLDGGSRSAGQGSSNFVLFSDDLPRILEINGTPTGQVPWNPGEWGGLLNR